MKKTTYIASQIDKAIEKYDSCADANTIVNIICCLVNQYTPKVSRDAVIALGDKYLHTPAQRKLLLLRCGYAPRGALTDVIDYVLDRYGISRQAFCAAWCKSAASLRILRQANARPYREDVVKMAGALSNLAKLGEDQCSSLTNRMLYLAGYTSVESIDLDGFATNFRSYVDRQQKDTSSIATPERTLYKIRHGYGKDVRGTLYPLVAQLSITYDQVQLLLAQRGYVCSDYVLDDIIMREYLYSKETANRYRIDTAILEILHKTYGTIGVLGGLWDEDDA